MSEHDTPSAPAANALQLHDARPFFEKALAYGVAHGIIDAAKLAAMNADAPKGMVQIARYFGSEFLRPELEKARDRMVNLVSLYLLESTGGDLHEAAVAIAALAGDEALQREPPDRLRHGRRLDAQQRGELAHRHRGGLQRLQRLLLPWKQAKAVQPLAHPRAVQPRGDEQGTADTLLDCLGHEVDPSGRSLDG